MQRMRVVLPQPERAEQAGDGAARDAYGHVAHHGSAAAHDVQSVDVDRGFPFGRRSRQFIAR